MTAGRPRAGADQVCPDQVCPVCCSADRGAAVCRVCGWQLLGDYVLGPATEAGQRDIAARLADAQSAYDLRAAARAAGPVEDRDLALLARLAGLARCGPPSPEQIERAVAEVDAADALVARTSAGIGFALNRLVAGQTEAIAFVEIGADSVGVQILVADPLGVPARRSGDSLPWTGLLPRLPPDDDDLRRLRMAGGIGSVPADGGPGPRPATPAALIAVMDEAIKPALAILMAAAAASRLDTVLVRRTYRWPVLDAAIMRARLIIRPVAEIVVPAGTGDLATVVDDVAARAPLRYGYDLVLVDVDAGNGAVTVKPHKLFSAGAAALPGARPAVRIDVAAVPGHAASRLALPIVARRGIVTDYRDLAALADRRPLVQMAAMDGATAETAKMKVTLLRPGQVTVQAGAGLLAPAAPLADWPGLISGLPPRVSPAEAPGSRRLDLVLLVELGGTEEAVAARVRLAQDVVDVLARAARDAAGPEPSVKVAAVGYRDHFGKHRVDVVGQPDAEHQALVVGFPLVRPARAASAFRRAERWQAVPVRDYHAAPIEDALQVIIGSQWEWQAQARHVLLVIGGRPPHPARAGPSGDAMLPCPHRFSWTGTLGRLRAAQAVECVAVLDRPATPGYAEQAWQELGAQGSYPAGTVTAGQLGRMAGLAPRTEAAAICLATRTPAASAQPREEKEAGG
ncbi:MAG TPA: hypothetical protein VKU77_39290 [Streptosporangiaceae bacterium]|nr:hypothetical protein [Streptosporangiaceae bacterium]